MKIATDIDTFEGKTIQSINVNRDSGNNMIIFTMTDHTSISIMDTDPDRTTGDVIISLWDDRQNKSVD